MSIQYVSILQYFKYFPKNFKNNSSSIVQKVQFVIIHYQSQSTLPKKTKTNKSKKKKEIEPKSFDFVSSAVNAKLKTSNNKHLNELLLNSPRISLSQSENIILDNRDTQESIVDFVCALKRKNVDFPDIYFSILEATQIPPKLVINKNAKAKYRGTWIPFKI